MIDSRIPKRLSGRGKVFEGNNELASVEYELFIKGSPRRPAITGRISSVADEVAFNLIGKEHLTLHTQYGYTIHFEVVGSYVQGSGSLSIQCTGEFTKD